MKKYVLPSVLLLVGFAGLVVASYIVRQEDSLDVRREAAGNVHYVCNDLQVDEDCQYIDISQAIDAAQDGDEIKILGTFDGPGVVSRAGHWDTPLGDDVKNLTISGELNNGELASVWTTSVSSANGHVVMFEQLTDDQLSITIKDIIIEPTTIDSPLVWIYSNNSGLEVNFENVEVKNSISAGILVDGDNSLNVSDSTFEQNHFAGVDIRGEAVVSIEKSKFIDHTNSSIHAQGTSEVTVSECIIRGSNETMEEENYGAIQFKDNVVGLVKDSTIKNNKSMALHLSNLGDTRIVRNKIFGNNLGSYGNGIITEDVGNLEIYNNVIYDNLEVGLFFGGSGDIEIINNTIVNNSGGTGPGGINIDDAANVDIRNNIVSSNNGVGVFVGNNHTGNLTIDYNNVWNNSVDDYVGLVVGSNDISLDPKFVGEDDFHLQDSSPCIDAGDPDDSYNDPDGSRNDMGAYGGQYASSDPTPNPPGCSAADIWDTKSSGPHGPDGVVNAGDLSRLLNFWNSSDPTADIWDTKSSGPHGPDGIVDAGDLSRLLSCWGFSY